MTRNLFSMMRRSLALNRVAGLSARLANVANGDCTASCGWSVDEENRVGPLQREVRLRRYPYPYRCALAVSNDTDGMSAEAFEQVHAFVNGTKPSPLGDGLGLEVGDSFWIWSWGGQFSLYHGSPYEHDLEPSPESARLAELGRLGWLDTLHGFGVWDNKWTIDRCRAKFALERLRELGIGCTVYSNHANMAHNIGGAWAYYQKGDLEGDPSYCLDLLRDFGFRYYWTDVFYELDKYGEHQVYASQADLDGAVARHDFHRFFESLDPADFSRTRTVFPDASRHELTLWKKKLFNRVLIPGTGRDGRPLYFFKRFRGRSAPDSGNFILQVNADRLDALEAAQGCAVVYQHLGVWRAIHMGKDHGSRRDSVLPILDEHARWAFRELAERQEAGRVFVTTTGRLLDYLWVRDRLDYEFSARGDTRVLRLRAVDCPCYGRSNLTPALLQGLSFEVPHRWGEVRVEVDGMVAPPAFTRGPDPSDPERDVLVFPWRRLEYPE